MIEVRSIDENVGWLEILVLKYHIRIIWTNPLFLLRQRLLGGDDWIYTGIHTGLEYGLLSDARVGNRNLLAGTGTSSCSITADDGIIFCVYWTVAGINLDTTPYWIRKLSCYT